MNPRLTLAALLLAGCVEPRVTIDGDEVEPTPPPVVYQTTAEQREEPYVHELAPEARCDEGDVVIGGGCSWGKRRDPERSYPVEVVQSRPSEDGGGWLCVGRRHGVGVEFELVTAYAICLEVMP